MIRRNRIELQMRTALATRFTKKATRCPSLKAMAYLAQANAAFTAGTYKTAYALYRKAYGYGR